VFTWFLNPVNDRISSILSGLEELLLWLPWPTVPLVASAAIARGGRYRSAVLVGLAMLLPGLFGLWKPTMQTLALVAVSVGLSVLIGVPLGILSGLDDRAERWLRPVLDGMQTVPSTAYLLPATLFFGIGPVPAAVATVVYALPPVVRLTSLGLRQVPVSTVEAGLTFGSSRRQLLTKVQLPQAAPQIATGVNQTIMMALGIVVIAALVGAGGLGQEALLTLQVRSPGRGFVVGGAIVALALVLDRVSRSFVEPVRPPADGPSRVVRYAAAVAGIVAVIVVFRAAGWVTFPARWSTSVADPVDRAITWVRDTFRDQTTWVNDFVVRELYLRGANFLKDTMSWPALVVATGVLGFVVRGWRLAVACASGVVVTGLLGVWEPALETLVQVLLAVAIATAIAVPVGVWVARRPRIEAALSPVLDALQTIPPLIYAIPFVMIFSVGVVPGGIIASVVYAIVPGIRVTALGIKGVPAETVEAATTFGASNRQLLWGVRLPLALPSIMLAVNQVIMMVVAMVVIAGLTGGGALGYLIIKTFTRSEIGEGVEVALALTVMAMILDRLSQGLAERFRPPAVRG
jgi:glycine betaine/proline transport system permease protein